MLGTIRCAMTLACSTGNRAGAYTGFRSLMREENGHSTQRRAARSSQWQTPHPACGHPLPAGGARVLVCGSPRADALAITTTRGQITKTQIALDAADRRSIAARVRADDAPVFSTGQSSMGSAQNPPPEQQESLGNVATVSHCVPRKKRVAVIRKPNSPLHLRNG